MFRPRWTKVLNDLLGNKTRTLLIVLSMAVGLFAVGIILSAQSILSTGLAHGYIEINPASSTLHIAGMFDKDFLQSIRSMKEVQAADARHTIQARVETGPGTWMDITIFAIADYGDIQVNKIMPQSGVWPPPKHEILIERVALGLVGAQVGDTVSIKLSDDTEREMRVAGTAYDPSQLPAQINNTPYGYVSFDTLSWLGEPHGFNELSVVVRHPEDSALARQEASLVKDKVENNGYAIRASGFTEPGKVPLEDILQGILLLMGGVGMLSLFLSAFLVVNTISALLAQQKRQIGAMKAIGGSTSQIFGMYLVMVIVYGFLALLISVPLGIWGAQALSQMLAGYFNINLNQMDISPQAILIQALVGLVLPVLASLVPFLSSLRINPAEAMSAYTASKGRLGEDVVDRLLSGMNLWFAHRAPVRSLILSLRNTFRSKTRLALTLITLTLAAATFISIFSLRSSLARSVDGIMQWMNFDVMLSFDQPYRSARVEQEALRVSGVTDTDFWIVMSGLRVRPDGKESDTIRIYASRPGSRLIHPPQIMEGRWLLPEDDNAVLVNPAILKREPDLGVGNDIVLKIKGKKHVFKIVGVNMGGPGVMSIYVPYSYLARLTNRFGEADALMVSTHAHDEAFTEAESVALVSYFGQLGIKVREVTILAAERAENEVLFDAIVTLLLIMAVLLALVGGLGLMGTMSINVLERTREIGVLRAIGASNRSVAQVFILEGIGIGLLSWLFGSLLAVPIGQWLGLTMGMAMLGSPLSFSYSMQGLFLWLGIVVLLSALASFIPARNASRLTVREVLAYE